MAKKRAAKKVAKAMPKKPKFLKYSKTANMLVYISIFFLVLNSVLLIFLKGEVLTALKSTGIEATPSSLALLGLIWLLMAFFSWSINRTIKEKQNKTSMWELFIISFIVFFSGRMEAGILMLIASIIYLVKAKKKK